MPGGLWPAVCEYVGVESLMSRQSRVQGEEGATAGWKRVVAKGCGAVRADAIRWRKQKEDKVHKCVRCCKVGRSCYAGVETMEV